jgi:hypothetical protein
MERIHNVRQAIASAKPYSVSLLAYGEAFVYSEGVLCYVDGSAIRILDIYSASKTEQILDVLAINQMLAPRLEPSLFLSPNETRITSLSYSEGILVYVCEADIVSECWLLAIDLGVQDNKDGSCTRIKPLPRLQHRLCCTTKLFIRHNRSYLYYGTHSGLRSDGHHEWLVTGFNLETGCPVAPKPFQLADFVGSDIGSTACFKIHESSLYAVSNQTSFEVEEVDWTSYYHCIKIPLGETKPDLKAHPIWQRQHGEGPINDSWTDLSLQKDDQTNELLIVECRKEWLGGGSANIRTYYTQPLRFNNDEDVIQMCNFPVNDPLTRTLDEHSKPHFSEPRKRIRKHYHHEYEHSRFDPRNAAPRDFILAKTKFRAYNPSAMSFVDLVSDPAPIPGSVRMRDRLRLRIASRKQKSPLIDDPDRPGHTLLRKPELELDEKDAPVDGSEHDFHPTETHLWPPDDAPLEIYDVLCPGGRLGIIEAVADERSIVYMTDDNAHAMNGGGRAIVMISFDPVWGRDLKKLVMTSTGTAARPIKEMKLELPNSFALRKTSKRASPAPESVSFPSLAGPSQQQLKRQRCEAGPSGAGEGGVGGKQRRLMWREEAMYRAINRGYRLR